MGKFFTQQLSTIGHEVSVLEHQDWDNANVLLGKAELVLVCVPIQFRQCWNTIAVRLWDCTLCLDQIFNLSLGRK
jgi:prephenate dehydrogenase